MTLLSHCAPAIFMCLFAGCVLVPVITAAEKKPARQKAAPPHLEYFQQETARLGKQCLAGIRSVEEWQGRRGEYQRQLQEMLGLWPMPERTDLKPVITGTLEHADFTVEKLHFQASPGLYVTANLYVPKRLEKPAPAILYVCGHAQVMTNGVSCGNKAGYQHHGAWFARNGYVCLLIDTLQYGEIQGAHRGTYSEEQWWWNARGYTPAGVEAWFGIRALDYLVSRPEVDRDRIGMTGRSGGGSYTWVVAAIDERVKVAAPIAGITDLHNQVVDGVVEGHCDCMFFINTYRWDFPQVAALLAPRPLLMGNSDKDRIFPLDGVVRLHQKVRSIYELYGATTNLGLLITEGPHADTQDLQVPVFRWFNRFLKREQPLIEMAAVKLFAPGQLRVFDQLPADQVNTRIQELFVPRQGGQASAGDPAAVLRLLREKSFGGWPGKEPSVPLCLISETRGQGGLRRVYELETQPGIKLPLYLLLPESGAPGKVVLTIIDQESWTNSPAAFLWRPVPGNEAADSPPGQLGEGRAALAFLVPRGVRPAERPSGAKATAQMRRRYMLLGQTLDGMRLWDIRCAIRALTAAPEFRDLPLSLVAGRTMGVNAAYAALFEPVVQKVSLTECPKSHREGPDYLNVLKTWDLPEMLNTLGNRLDLLTRNP